MRSLPKLLATFVFLSIGFLFASHVQAATKTICASLATCDYTTIAAAMIDSPGEGDIYEVRGG